MIDTPDLKLLMNTDILVLADITALVVITNLFGLDCSVLTMGVAGDATPDSGYINANID